MRRHNSANGQDGICGLVADIIEPEPSFELAVEAALGEALQHVIVKTQEQGIEATSYLADQGSGRGSFIPVNTYRPLADMIHLSEGNNEKEQVDLLLDHVGAKDGYETLTRQLLGNTIVAQDLTDALSLWNRNGSFRTIVTKDGDCVSCEGIITGGNSREAQTSILAKKREVKTLGELVSGMGTQLEAAKAEQEEMEALTCAVESEQQEVSKKLRQKESEHVDAEKTLYKLEEDLRHQNRHLEITRLEVEQLNGEETDLDREISECDKLLSRISEDVSAFNERIAVSQSQMQKESDEIEVSSQKLMDIRLELTSLKAKKENTINDLRRLRLFQNDSAERMHQLRKEIEDAERDMEVQKTKLETGKNQLKKDYADLKCIEMTLSENEESFRKIDNKLTENDRIIAEIETVQKKTLQKMQQLELKQSERRLKLQHLSSRIDERYHQDLTALTVSTNIEDMNVAEKETELAAMQEKMVRLGDVNLAAIEEFETLNERLDFYNAQYEDLEKGIENLKQVIARINTTTKRKFLKTFAAVNEKFNTVFPTLFEGGTANLELTDPHNPLESGVAILVHPPGKKVLRMSLLSGGEKALAALALIFSIYLIKPSPFCLLDEIDAPLDDVNVDRFTELMKRIAEHSQVIIVTHNKRSMAISDNLFGVTMGKKGVSQVVSVKLKDSTPP
jgi:chromosome segregation protein